VPSFADSSSYLTLAPRGCQERATENLKHTIENLLDDSRGMGLLFTRSRFRRVLQRRHLKASREYERSQCWLLHRGTLGWVEHPSHEIGNL